MSVKIEVTLDPRAAAVIEEMRQDRGEAARSAPPPDDENDLETAQRNMEALSALANAYATDDMEAAHAAMARMSPRMRWECEPRHARSAVYGTMDNKPDPPA